MPNNYIANLQFQSIQKDNLKMKVNKIRQFTIVKAFKIIRSK